MAKDAAPAMIALRPRTAAAEAAQKQIHDLRQEAATAKTDAERAQRQAAATAMYRPPTYWTATPREDGSFNAARLSVAEYRDTLAALKLAIQPADPSQLEDGADAKGWGLAVPPDNRRLELVASVYLLY